MGELIAAAITAVGLIGIYVRVRCARGARRRARHGVAAVIRKAAPSMQADTERFAALRAHRIAGEQAIRDRLTAYRGRLLCGTRTPQGHA